jgi:hypothetical protein
MQLQEKKLELLDWILHLNDVTILKNIENIKLKFATKKTKENPGIPEYGCMKGQIIMTWDFNGPLDDFKEYM